MSFDLSIEVRNKALNKAFREASATNDNEMWLAIPGVPGSPEDVRAPITFALASSGEISNATSPMFVVGAGTTINRVDIYKNEGLTQMQGRITLEGEEIKEYPVNGTFTINTLKITTGVIE